MPSTILSFFATIDASSPPSEQLWDSPSGKINLTKMRPLSSSCSGGGAGYCPRVCPQSAQSFSAIVLRQNNCNIPSPAFLTKKPAAEEASEDWCLVGPGESGLNNGQSKGRPGRDTGRPFRIGNKKKPRRRQPRGPCGLHRECGLSDREPISAIAASATHSARIVDYQPKWRRWQLACPSLYDHNDLGRRNLLIVRRRGGHLHDGKKRVAGFRELPAGIVPQDVPRAKNIEIGCES
jgi:hypothetical protein